MLVVVWWEGNTEGREGGKSQERGDKSLLITPLLLDQSMMLTPENKAFFPFLCSLSLFPLLLKSPQLSFELELGHLKDRSTVNSEQ